MPRRRAVARKRQRTYRSRRGKINRLTAPNVKNSLKQHGYEYDISSEVPPLPVQTLQITPISLPSWGGNPTSGDGFNGSRGSSTIHVSGIRWYHEVTCDCTEPIMVNFALIQPRAGEGNNTNIKADFFRDPANVLDKSKDFVDNVLSEDWANRMLKLNPDKFHILTHKRFQLDPRTSVLNDSLGEPQFNQPYTTKEAKFHKKMDTFLKIGKTFNFDRPGDVFPRHPIYVVWWWVPLFSNSFPTVASDGSQLYSRTYSTVHFKDM